MRQAQTSYGPITVVMAADGSEMIQTDELLGVAQYGLLMANLKLLKEQKVIAPPANKPLPRKMRTRPQRRRHNASR